MTQSGENAKSLSAPPSPEASGWEHSSHPEFYEYYARESLSPEAIQRFRAIRDAVLRIRQGAEVKEEPLEVADIGCGAGTQSLLWAELGHRVHGLDVNAPLLELARERAAKTGSALDLQIGSAAELPWTDGSMDVCLAVELMEHVPNWQVCLEEFARVLRPGGILFLTTTNFLCPSQQEFNLPLYSWYPARVKRRYEELARTTRPQLANFAKYPAVNWFSFYSLRRVLRPKGFDCRDRFDLWNPSGKPAAAKSIVKCIRAIPPLRLLAHAATSGTMLLAIKHGASLR